MPAPSAGKLPLSVMAGRWPGRLRLSDFVLEKKGVDARAKRGHDVSIRTGLPAKIHLAHHEKMT